MQLVESSVLNLEFDATLIQKTVKSEREQIITSKMTYC
jgi:hypothetical protein